MPLIMPWVGTRKPGAVPKPGAGPVGGAVPAKVTPTVQASQQISRHADPRAPATVSPSVGSPGFDLVTDDTITATTGTQAKIYELPMMGDVTELYVSVSDTIGGTLTGTGNAYKTFNLIEIIRRKGGKVVCQFRGTDIPNLFAVFSKHENAAPAGTGSSSPISVSVPVPCLSLPAAKGPYALRVTYEAYTNLGFGSATSGTYSVEYQVVYGLSQNGMEANMTYMDFALPSGTFDLGTVAPVQDQAIAEVIISGFAADTDLNFIEILVNGSPAAPRLTQAALSALWSEAFNASRPTGTFAVASKIIRQQLAFNRSSHFFINMAVGTDTPHFLFYWLEA